MKGVSEYTSAVLEKIQHYKELQEYFLVGGTALAIHLDHRLSEDLDLFQYNKFPSSKRFPLKHQNTIIKRLKDDFVKVEISLSDKYNTNILVDDVRVQLFSENKFHRPKRYGNIGYIKLPDERILIGMKMTALVLRKAWRDYYDLYCLVKSGRSLEDFQSGYNEVMSSYFTDSSKLKKEKLYYHIQKELYNLIQIQRCYRDDNMDHLNVDKQVTPEVIASEFSSFFNQNG